ncbi:U-box domain-containing protein 52 [Camellia lanceoleosa]|uniref:U-box domain-containing protein 52 n=1 Tax=Camellia lanceoleosa TaxID=1840588 RepID=A0ACC0HSA1_9ERIC|nr:U-box domain-containing protein 52 [Camellia lanceoleosa]
MAMQAHQRGGASGSFIFPDACFLPSKGERYQKSIELLILKLPFKRLVHEIAQDFKDIMEEPCVAANGYTYDRKAIQTWLEENDKSPMTNLPLPTRNLIPNYTLLYAISEWKSGKQ